MSRNGNVVCGACKTSVFSFCGEKGSRLDLFVEVIELAGPSLGFFRLGCNLAVVDAFLSEGGLYVYVSRDESSIMLNCFSKSPLLQFMI